MKRKEGKTKKVQTRFGERIRKLRKAKGWSQEKMAEETDLHRTYIGGIERGERNLSLVNIKKIADTLNVSLSRLFEEI